VFAAVKGIKKQHLVEVKALTNPPASVRLALESICLLLGESTADFKSIRSIIVRDNFINTIVNFNTESITYVTTAIGCLINTIDCFYRSSGI
jgi:dynein heavy chain 1